MGIRFNRSNLSLSQETTSFRFTQHNLRDGIWVPKPIGAVRRISGLISPGGHEIPRLNDNNQRLFIPGVEIIVKYCYL